MFDCLILVERGVSEPDLVKDLLASGYQDYFKQLLRADANALASWASGQERSVLADYGLATQISLTSVVLATELTAAGLSFEIIDDDDIVVLYRDVIVERLAHCRLVALSSTYTVHLRTLLGLLALIRAHAPDVPILIGGQGLSAWRLHDGQIAALYQALAAADALFFGEVEGRLATLVQRLIERRSLALIPGVVDLRGALPQVDVQPVEVELDQTLLPDWSLLARFPVNDGALLRQGLPQVAAIEEGRGCSFRCRFCSYPLYAGFRRKSPARVVAELTAISRAGFTTAAFCGAEFLNPIAHSQPVFEHIAAARLNLDIWAYARLDLVSHRPIFADLMERARFRFIQFGMESGDRSVLKAMGKNYDPTRMATGAALLRERGIEVYASLIVGYPGETADTLANTLAVLADCDFAHVIVHALNVVPGSPLWHRRHEYGLEVSRLGFWSHRTLSLRQVPGMVRHLIVELGARTHSVLNIITQNFTNRFFTTRPQKEQLIATTCILQRIIEHEWRQAREKKAQGSDVTPSQATSDAERLALWQALVPHIHQVPPELLVKRRADGFSARDSAYQELR